nr:hypothetical protein [Chloroflexota bacterium]
VISPVKDKTHPKPFIRGKDITKWAKRRISYLEWGTERAPSKFRRSTFIELQQAKPKLMVMKNSGAEIVAIYDDEMTFFDVTIISFISWHIFENVINKSINKTAKYKHQDPLGDREEREIASRKFHIKYLLAILNSSFTKRWIDKKRRHKVSIYPDDWKQLPIAPISLEGQKDFVKLVDKILSEYDKQGYPLPEPSAEKVREWQGQLDVMVGKIYE